MSLTKASSLLKNAWIRNAVLAGLMVGTLGLVGCGGAAGTAAGSGGGNGIFMNQNHPGTGNLQVRVGDSPADRVVSLQLTFSSIKVVSASGQSELLQAPTSVELTHLAATNVPVGLLDVTPDDYTQLVVSVSNATVTYLDPNTNQPVQQQFSNPSVVTVNLNPAVTVSSSSSVVLSIDVDVAQTVNLDLVNDTVSINDPVITAAAQPMSDPATQQPASGKVEHVIGTINSVSGSHFTMTDGQSGASLIFNTNASTGFGNSTLASLTNAMVQVQAQSLTDGSMMAIEVENLGASNGSSVEGIMTGYNNGGYMGMVAQDGTGLGMDSSLIGGSFSLDLSGTSNYNVDTNGIDMSNLSFVFDANSIMPGQRVVATSGSGVQQDPQGGAGYVQVGQIELQPQSVSGTVNAYSGVDPSGNATFDLVLPNDGSSYLSAVNAGTTDVIVYQRSTTDMSSMSSGLSQGQPVRVRGLLFYYDPGSGGGPNSVHRTRSSNGSGNQPYFVLVATRITQ